MFFESYGVEFLANICQGVSLRTATKICDAVDTTPHPLTLTPTLLTYDGCQIE
jgi:hypothetical protein